MKLKGFYDLSTGILCPMEPLRKDSSGHRASRNIGINEKRQDRMVEGTSGQLQLPRRLKVLVKGNEFLKDGLLALDNHSLVLLGIVSPFRPELDKLREFLQRLKSKPGQVE